MATYKLTVGDVAEIQLNIDSVTTKFSGQEFYVTMESLTYSKKIFAPSEIHTVLSVKAKKETTTSFPTLGELQSTFSKQLVTLKDGDTTVAENFFVYKMKPSHGKVSNSTAAMKVELFIYSLDKILTIDKYCNAFTAKKLGGEIFTNELKKFKLNGTAINGSVNLQFLNYASTIESGKTVEIRQPYLIQYNESFYDFIARSASRCGEMLYFEGGNLHLGMSANLDTASTDQTTVAESVDYEDSLENVLSVDSRYYNFFDRGEDDDNRYVDSTYQLVGARDQESKTVESTDGTKTNGKVTKTTTINYDKGTKTVEETTEYYTSKDKDPEKELAGEPKSKVTVETIKANDSDDESKKTVLRKETTTVTYTYTLENGHYKKEGNKFKCKEDSSYHLDSGEEKQGYYNQPAPNDALFKEIKKDGYTNIAEEMYDSRTFYFNLFLLHRLNETSLYDMIANVVLDVVGQAKDAGVSQREKNDKNNRKNLTLDSKKNPDQVSGDTYNLFSTLKSASDVKKLTVNQDEKGTVSPVSLLMSAFYSKIQEASRYVSQLIIRLNYGSNNSGLNLGDIILADGGYFVVIKVDLNDEKNHIVEAIPAFYEKSDSGSLTAAIPCPPLLPEISVVRTSDPQVAFVENNLDPDRLGRVRVRYPWQPANGDCSPWVRMATPFATNGGGVTFKPEEGDEVLLNYEDGNIERPYIVGSLQSKYVTDHWGALEDRVIQSKNGHTIKFKDDDGLDFFTSLVPAADFIKSCIPISKPVMDFQNVDDLAGGIEITDRYGFYKIDLSSSGRSVSIESPMGNIDLNAFTGISISAPNGNIEIKGKNVAIEASNKLTLSSGSAVQDRFFKPGWDNLKNLVDKVADSIDFPLLRTVLEVFIRPVDGTLKIKSNTFVLIEAGEGSTQIPKSDYNKPGVGTGLDQMFDTDVPPVMGKLNRTIDSIGTQVDTLCDAIKTAFTEASKAKADYEKVDNYDKLSKRTVTGTDDIVTYIKNNKANPFNIDNLVKEDDFDFDNIKEFQYKILEKKGDKYEPKKYEEPKPGDGEDVKVFNDRKAKAELKYKNELANDNTVIKPKREAVVKAARDFGTKLKALYDAADAWKAFDLDPAVKPNVFFADSLKTKIQGYDIFGSFIADTRGGTIKWDTQFETGFAKEVTILKRKIVYELLDSQKDDKDCKTLYSFGKAKKPNDYSDNDEWAEFAKSIEEAEDSFSAAKAGWATLGYLREHFWDKSPWADTFVSRNRWNPNVKGKILLSDKPGRTMHFDADGLAADNNVSGNMTQAHIFAFKRKVNEVK